MYNIIQHSHSGIMWLVVIMLFLSVIFSMIKLIKKDEADSAYWYKFFRITKLLMYLQALLGITLMFISPMVHYASGFMKNEELRFYGMEHPLMMLIAIGLVSIGLYKSKKKPTIVRKNTTVFIYFSIALIAMVLIIPWNAVLS